MTKTTWPPTCPVATPLAESAPAAAEASRFGQTALLAVIGFGVAVRLAIFAAACHSSGGLSAAYGLDTPTYLLPAESLLSTGRFAVDGTPELLRSPGYSLFLTPGLLAGHVELVTLVLQLLLVAATIWLVYDITLSWTDRRSAALAAAFLVAIEPMSIVFSCMLMAETLFTFLIVLSVHRLLRYLATQSLASLGQTAILLAMATFARPVSYYLPTILAVVLLAHGLSKSGGRVRAACHAAMFWAICMSPLIAWQARNYAQTGYSGFAAIADFNLYFFHGASVLAHERGQPIETVQTEMGLFADKPFDQLHPELRPGDQAARFHFLHDEGTRLVCEHPWTFTKTYLRGLAILIVNPGASEVLAMLHCYPNDRPPRPMNLGLLGLVHQMHATAPRLFYSNLVLLFALVTAYLTAAYGLATELRHVSWRLASIATVALYFLAVSGGAASVTRLRHPVMPLVFVLSGIGIAQLAAWRHRRRASEQATTEIAPQIAGCAAA